MEQFLGNAPTSQLLYLIAMPLGASVLLVVVLLIFYSRNKRPEMKLGVNFNRPTDSQTSLPEDSDELDISVLSSFSKPKTTTPEITIAEQPTLPSGKIEMAEPIEMMRLLRHPETGRLVVQVGEQRYKKLAEIQDKQIGQYILELTAHLLAFTSGMLATVVGVKSVGIPKVGQLPMFPTVAKPPPIRDTALPDILIIPKQDVSPLTGFSLAGEINEIVQNRLAYSPLAKTTRVEVTTGRDGGIKITVNGHAYSSPDEIPNSDTRHLIKEAIKEWERS
jgi:hypothetical protein